jgi:hypothetical protein
MRTRKSSNIPDAEWVEAPNLSDWIDQAQKERLQKTIRKHIDAPQAKRLDFGEFKPANRDYMEHFDMARGLRIQDVGVNDNCIFVSLLGGVLTVDFVDKTLSVEPHQNGQVIDYHIAVPETLGEVFSYKPTDTSGISACIFVIKGENHVYEYLISPTVNSTTFSFHLEFEAHHA